MRQLRPGIHVVRRDDRHLQVGVDPPGRAVVPDEPDVRRLLADLGAGRRPAPETAAGHRALRALLAADLLIDPAARTAVTRARGAVAVSVQADGQGENEATRLLRAAGCTLTTAAESTIALVIADGEPRRDVVDTHLRDGRAHLLVTATPWAYAVGPFVVPGRTACLRCLDAHRSTHDPRRAVVVEQVAGLGAGPLDPALAALATAWAVRDVLAFVDGEEPSTWSATVEIDPGLAPRRHTWTRHPHCGCSWADGLIEARPVAG